MKKDIYHFFEIIARLNPNAILLLLDIDGNVLDYNSKANSILLTIDDKKILAVDDGEKFKKYLKNCSRNLNLLTGGFTQDGKRYYTEGSILSVKDSPENSISIILFISEKNKFVSNFKQLNQVTDLSYEISKHKALEKKLRDQTLALMQSEQEIRDLVNLDHLTGLASKTFFQELTINAISNASQATKKIGILFCDLDKFKIVNDTLGHDIGDLLLKKVASEIKRILPKGCVAARFGGDEFVILIDNEETILHLTKFIEKITKIFSQSIEIKGSNAHISISIGIAIYPNDGLNYEELAKHADLALYNAKEVSGSSYSFFSQKLKEEYVRLNKIENKLRDAIVNDALFVHYQPQYDLETMKICGVEVLCCWIDPELGVVSPGEFIVVAEQVGLIKELTKVVFNKALREFRECEERYPELFENIKLSLNVSAFYMDDVKAFDSLIKIVKNFKIANRKVCFEVTETALIRHKKTAIKLLSKLAVEGYSNAIDDFGVGHSSLSYLKDLPVSVLKIDISFIKDIDKDKKSFAITEAIIKMGSTLGMYMIAEGVENQQQVKLLQQIECDAAQGFFLAKPMSIEDVISLLEKEK
ncbi:EAL domain-containing protein [Francisella sp. 19X1-34]|uniref:putative bifunctional diguanylate cyclase/phosphodiesterase n=1 Tax=Francisella sp. 19X1-34 TaxID=3087177 RepID=UPI002E34A4A0|nr:EAL domain-containing protein [Francisella sp. 19X1-34]MED7788308.1 EAL domain-containing protein [Francisella sp. 19X1-34]